MRRILAERRGREVRVPPGYARRSDHVHEIFMGSPAATSSMMTTFWRSASAGPAAAAPMNTPHPGSKRGAEAAKNTEQPASRSTHMRCSETCNSGTPGVIRTRDPLLRRQLLCPLSYGGLTGLDSIWPHLG